MSSVSSTSSSYSIPVSSTSSLSSVSYSDLSTQSLNNASTNLSSILQDYSNISSRSGAYNTLAAALQTFIGQAPSFEDQTQVAGLTAGSNSNLIGVTIGSQAVAGSYAVSVSQLAMAQTSKSKTTASATATALYGSGTLSIKVGSGAATAISINNGMSPTDLANAINNAKAGVSAQVTGSGTSFAVTVTGNNTGAANAITFTESGTNTGFGSNLVQAAQDANYTVNGKAFTSSTNTTVNGVPGVVMNFTGIVSNATVTVAANASSVAASLTSFINSYNSVITAINTARGNDALASNPALDALSTKLGRIIGNASTGASGTFRSLADVGITRNSDNTYTVNSNTLAAATATNPGSAANLLTGTALGTNGLAADLDAVVTAYGEPGVGTLGRIGYGLARAMLKMGRRMDNEQSRIDTITEGLTAQYVNLQVALSKYAAQSIVVSALTAQTGISTEGFDLRQTR